MVTIAIPVVAENGLQSELNEHFGMTEDFAVFDSEDVGAKGLNFISNDPRETGAKSNAQFLVEHGVKIVLSGWIGPHMLDELLAAGVRVFKGAVGTVGDVIEDYRAGMLTEVRSPGEMTD